MAEKHFKCSTSLTIREVQIKTAVRHHLTPVKMAKGKNTNYGLYCRGCGAKGTLFYCWWECRLVQPFWKSIWWFLRKLEINLPQDPVIPLLGIYPKDAQSYHKGNCSTMFIVPLFVIARTWNNLDTSQLKIGWTKCSTFTQWSIIQW